MSYSALWGAVQTDFMAPAGTLLSTVATSGAIPVVSVANQSQPYYSTLSVAALQNTGRVLSVGVTPNASSNYYAPSTTTGALQPNGNCLPLTALANASIPYFYSN